MEMEGSVESQIPSEDVGKLFHYAISAQAGNKGGM